MRESLTVLALLLIVVLTTALVGPYFVDWNTHRGEIEARLSGMLGAKVAIAGPIDLKLLPRPIFRLQRLSVSGGTAQDAQLSAERVDVELALTALLRGEIQFIDADVTRPRLRLTIAPDGSILLPALNGTDPGRVSLSHLAIHDGRVDFAGRNSFALSGLEGDGEADSLAGPFKFTGRLNTPRGVLGFRVATSAFEGQKLRLKGTLDPVAGTPKTEIEGMLSMAPAPSPTSAPSHASALSFDGIVTAGGAVPLAGSRATIPWNLASKLHAEAGRLTASDVDLRAGSDGRALVATGTGEAEFGASAAGHLVLRARQMDAGQLAVATGDSSPSPEPSIAVELAALKSFLENDDAFAALPFPVTVDYAADTVTFGSQTLANLAGQATLAAGKPVVGSLSVEAGDGSRIKLNGNFEPGPAAVFKGRLDASSRDLGRFAGGLNADLPEAAAWLRRSLPVKAFGFSGSVDLSGIGFAAHDSTIAIDRSTFTGTITLTRAVGDERARLFADLTSDALDLDALPDWQDAAETASTLDLALTLSARAIRLTQTDIGSVDAGRIALQLNKTGSTVTLDRLSLADLGSATAELTGRSDGKTAHLEGRFDARKLRDLARLISRIAPGSATDALSSRADALSPALFQISADAAFDPDGNLLPTALSLDGTAAGTKVGLHLKPGSSAADGTARPPVTLSVVLDAPESGALLRQIGIPTLPTTAIGRGRIEANARVGESGSLDGKVTASLADTKLSFTGHGSLAGEVAGHLMLRGPNVAPTLRAITLATPDGGAIWPAEADTEIIWSNGRVTAKGLSGRLIGTGFSGDMSFVPPPDATSAALGNGGAGPQPAALTGTMNIDRVPMSLLAGLALGPLPQPKPGAIWLDTSFGPSLLRLPRSDLALKVGVLPISETAIAQNAALTLRLAPGVITLSDLSASLGEGRIGATMTLRRDGAAASLSGRLEWSSLPLATPSLGGRSSGTLDLAGTGASAAALVAGLAGNGTISIRDARLPRFDPDAINRVVAATNAATTIDDQGIGQDLARELDRGALALGDITAPVTVAAGVLRAQTVKVDGPAVSSETIALLDLRTLLWSMRTTATMRIAPPDWTGTPPQVGIIWKGPFAAPAREIDAAALINGIAGRAIARDQAKIEAFQADVRERSFFANRLKAIEAEAQAQRDRARAEAEVAPQTTPPLRSPADGGSPKSSARPDTTPDAKNIQSVKPTPEGAKQPSTVPVPVPRPSTRLNSVAKPVELQHPGQAFRPSPVPSTLADPGTAGRY